MPRREIAPGRSCLECRRRRIKCDRSRPCSYCVKVRIECKYPTSRSVLDEDQGALSRIAVLELRLATVEKRLSDIDGPRPGAPSSATASLAQHQNGEALAQERDERFVGMDISRTHSPSLAPPSHTPSNDSLRSAIVNPQPPVELASFRPSGPTIALLWQRYLEVVDPLLKVFHTPTVQGLVIRAIATRGRDPLDMASECLLFVIYYATIAAMSPENCLSEFDEERIVLLKRYRLAVENLLSRLNTLASFDLMVLQAFTIYLIMGRCDEEGSDAYGPIGLAAGMALNMGLNRDGEAAGLPPFEVEMRRRLWWQLCILDIRVAEDRHSEPCILESSFNTRLPSNVSDVNLHPEMSRVPIAENGRTEMLYSLVRFEGSYFARQLVFSKTFSEENGYMQMSVAQKCHAIDLFQERIEKQYLVHCDDQIPFDRVIVESIRLVLAKLRLSVQVPEKEQLHGTQETQIKAWVNFLKDAENLRAYEPGKQLLWLFQTYLEWDALLNILTCLREGSPREEVDQAWEVSYRVYNYWKDLSIWRDHRWQRIEQLRKEVLAARHRSAPGPALES
ncbi:fungal-specific transcription factor domain-containing protein [Aspergillus pseudoustus]|uniref:Fungal-specific transcription factor domain-containing protein n=1 Tax=Aspergillus pseudoustus TaxID=1810923 RepID=A0ABR4JL96_9EURO